MDRPVVVAIASALMVGGGVNACTSTMNEPVAQGAGGASSTAASAPAGAATSAAAELKDKAGASKGRATAQAMGNGVHVTANLANVAPGTYAVHVHTVGNCTAPDFTSAGPHWNPEGKQHGKDNPAGPHKGDLPNVTIGADGRGTVSSHITGVTLTGGSNALLDADGAAVVLHAGVDDYRTDPTGNAGGRAACGVFAAGS
jgi:Cu-Zn family superoxide dismutase